MLVYWLIHEFQKMPIDTIKAKLRKFAWLFAGLAMMLLVASGRLNWLFAILGVAMAFLFRLLPTILRYAPQLQRLWDMFRRRTDESYRQQNGQSQSGNAGLTKTEALEILGLKLGASEEEIILAHRKLIAKLHPDKGGSDYLAAKINLAKKVLLHR
jgi:hypothetical protein